MTGVKIMHSPKRAKSTSVERIVTFVRVDWFSKKVTARFCVSDGRSVAQDGGLSLV